MSFHKPHKDLPGIERTPLWCEVGDYLPEQWHGPHYILKGPGSLYFRSSCFIPYHLLTHFTSIVRFVDTEYSVIFQVIQLLDVFPQGLGFVLVFEFMPSGLWEMLRDAENPLMVPQIKTYMIMLLKGVAYLHEHSIMHRVRLLSSVTNSSWAKLLKDPRISPFFSGKITKLKFILSTNLFCHITHRLGVLNKGQNYTNHTLLASYIAPVCCIT